ncbi:MAG TPA: hypothetical protein VNZ03_18070 [Terriglobales bacterium]|nr:hypothetical protein [Terriglobales bacterium]
MKRPSRQPAELSESLHRQLSSYALAASAAGVGMLALAQPAGAKIVYTPANVTITTKPFAIDLNHDGINDFYLQQYYSHFYPKNNDLLACNNPFYQSTHRAYICYTKPSNLNGVVMSSGRKFANALRPGVKIQRGDRIRVNNAVRLGGVSMSPGTTTKWYGPWVNGGEGVKDRFLGLRFKINGLYHFGWARISVTTTKNTFTAVLKGYAYETIPHKAIIAGQTRGPDVIVRHATLGELAAGRK